MLRTEGGRGRTAGVNIREEEVKGINVAGAYKASTLGGVKIKTTCSIRHLQVTSYNKD